VEKISVFKAQSALIGHLKSAKNFVRPGPIILSFLLCNMFLDLTTNKML
jgi:hypothetical protein